MYSYLHLLNQDNASNCDTTAVHLASHIPTFRGMPDRLRCLLHCVQIAANVSCVDVSITMLYSLLMRTSQMVMSFFNKQYKRKKVAAMQSAIMPATVGSTVAMTETDMEALDAEEEELLEILDKDSEAETAVQALERAIADAGQAEQDEQVISGIRQQAIVEMARDGIVISASEQAAARKVLPKVHMAYYRLMIKNTRGA